MHRDESPFLAAACFDMGNKRPLLYYTAELRDFKSVFELFLQNFQMKRHIGMNDKLLT